MLVNAKRYLRPTAIGNKLPLVAIKFLSWAAFPGPELSGEHSQWLQTLQVKNFLFIPVSVGKCSLTTIFSHIWKGRVECCAVSKKEKGMYMYLSDWDHSLLFTYSSGKASIQTHKSKAPNQNNTEPFPFHWLSACPFWFISSQESLCQVMALSHL